MTAVDFEVVYLPHDGSVEHKLARVTLLLVHGAAPAVLDHPHDAAAAERVTTLDGYHGLAEHSAAHGAQEGMRLLHELGGFAGRRHLNDRRREVQRSP